MTSVEEISKIALPLFIVAAMLTVSWLGAPAAQVEPATAFSDDLIGTPREHMIQDGDSLPALAVAYKLGYIALLAANPGVDVWTPEVGTELVLPTVHLLPSARAAGITINVGDLRLYHFPEQGGPVRSWPVGIGRAGLETPLLEVNVTELRRSPVWRPGPAIRRENPSLPTVVPPGPNNPLGPLAIRIGWEGYLIHGTIKPTGIGRRVSRGCIRMYNEDIGELFELVKVGTPVVIVNEPVKLGWHQGELFLQAHPNGRQADALEASGSFTVEHVPDLRRRIHEMAADARRADIDWPLVERTVRERRGIPVAITHRSDRR